MKLRIKFQILARCNCGGGCFSFSKSYGWGISIRNVLKIIMEIFLLTSFKEIVIKGPVFKPYSPLKFVSRLTRWQRRRRGVVVLDGDRQPSPDFGVESADVVQRTSRRHRKAAEYPKCS